MLVNTVGSDLFQKDARPPITGDDKCVLFFCIQFPSSLSKLWQYFMYQNTVIRVAEWSCKTKEIQMKTRAVSIGRHMPPKKPFSET